jgi:septal ring factor EnvC (AmiA/AmiB activator)
MAMETVLKQLESRIEELVGSYRDAIDRTAELETRIGELEAERDTLQAKLIDSSQTGDRLAELEQQRDALAGRLEAVLGVIDDALSGATADD